MADQAYFVGPKQIGPGVLLLPPWWGATSEFRRRADALADEGFTVLAPDLNFGARPTTVDEAQSVLAEADPDRLAGVVQASAGLLADKSAQDRISVVGFGMGGSLGLWLSVRRPDLVASTVSVYASQSIDFAGSQSRYQLHFAEHDDFVSDDDAAFLEATMRMEHLDVEVVDHEQLPSGFADDAGPDFDEAAADDLWDQIVAFLHAGVEEERAEQDARATDAIAEVQAAVADHLDTGAGQATSDPDDG